MLDTAPAPPPAAARPAAHRLDRDGHGPCGHVTADARPAGFDRASDEPIAPHAVGAREQDDQATDDLDGRRLVLALARGAAA